MGFFCFILFWRIVSALHCFPSFNLQLTSNAYFFECLIRSPVQSTGRSQEIFRRQHLPFMVKRTSQGTYPYICRALGSKYSWGWTTFLLGEGEGKLPRTTIPWGRQPGWKFSENTEQTQAEPSTTVVTGCSLDQKRSKGILSLLNYISSKSHDFFIGSCQWACTSQKAMEGRNGWRDPD